MSDAKLQRQEAQRTPHKISAQTNYTQVYGIQTLENQRLKYNLERSQGQGTTLSIEEQT